MHPAHEQSESHAMPRVNSNLQQIRPTRCGLLLGVSAGDAKDLGPLDRTGFGKHAPVIPSFPVPRGKAPWRSCVAVQ